MHAELSETDRKTHVGGRELDRVLLSPKLRNGEGLEFKSVENRRSLGVRGTADMGSGVDYDLPADQQDLSDHFPLMVVLSDE